MFFGALEVLRAFTRSLSCSFLLAAATSARLVNRTIDDKSGDSVSGALPVYSPDGAWADGSICSTCNIFPQGTSHMGPGIAVEPSKTFRSSWHDSTYHPGLGPSTITVKFTGEAVYVYNLIANNIAQTTTVTNLTFSLDDMLVGNFFHQPDENAHSLVYNVTVYANTSLSHSPHTLVISAGGATDSLVLFDYIVYTIDEAAADALPTSIMSQSSGIVHQTSSSPTLPSDNHQPPHDVPESLVPSSSANSSKKPSVFVGGLVGGLVGGILAALIILAGIFLFRRYGHRRRRICTSKDHEDLQSGARCGVGMRNVSPTTVSIRRGTDSTASLIPSEPGARYPSTLSENLTAVAPYSDPKFVWRASRDASKPTRSSRAQSPPRRTRSPSSSSRGPPPQTGASESDVRPSSASTLLPGFTFVRAPTSPPAHSVDVPDPALSVTGTERSLRQGELTRQIRELEETVRDMQYPGRPSPRPAGDEQHLPRMSERERMRTLKDEIAKLRVELANEQRLILEAAPRTRKPKLLAVVA
ncbi:hypothetical protein C8Q78DRAFT_658566 [Trametes maxima]|nr:hypothetical protein C8Q78DRAFT_658566 [Trametes maxima]